MSEGADEPGRAVDAALHELFGLRPEGFTARRKELVAAARRSGDADAARAIGAARRPTVAAWAVNVLVRADPSVRTRLAAVRAALQAAHTAMDGARIRELTRAQRLLVDELTRAAMAAAGLETPSPALLEDVSGTFQAAVADADVAARLGRLSAAQRWSGFGDFAVPQAPVPQAPVPEKSPPRSVRPRDTRAAQRRRAAASAARDRARERVDECRAAVASARRRYEQLLAGLAAAEQAIDDAVVAVERAEAELARADSALRGIGDPSS